MNDRKFNLFKDALFYIFNYFKKRPKTLVFVITFLVYSPVLFNQYVGDDHVVFERNTFYHSWKNIPRVLGKGYFTNYQDIILNTEDQIDFGTTCDAYKPVTELTFFIDGCVFQTKPFWSHLINILVHCVNAVLLYWIVYQIFFSSILGVFAALLFSLHPIQSEAVAIVSQRRDIFTAMLVLWSFYFWIKFKLGSYVRKKYYYGSLLMCLLALFSKESAIVFPFVIIVFDRMLTTPTLNLKQRAGWYLGLMLVLAFYVWVYFFIFPNGSFSHRNGGSGALALDNSSHFLWLGGSWINHCLILGFVGYHYLINILTPWTVQAIPGQYHPTAPTILSLLTVKIVAVFVVFLTSFYLLWRYSRECGFFLLWFIIFYLPVSNLIPLSNPMANRYMYLPSIGLLIVLAFLLDKVFKSDFLMKYSQHLSGLFYAAVIMFCMTRTFFLNGDWRSDFDVGWAWVRDFPADGQGYALLGEEYLRAGHADKAKEYLEKSVLLGNQMPSDVIYLAECNMVLGKFSEAEHWLKRLILLYPDDYDPLFYLGEIYYIQRNYPQAQEMLEKAINLNPQRPQAYSKLMKAYLNQHKLEDAENILNKAELFLNAQNVSELRKIFKESRP